MQWFGKAIGSVLGYALGGPLSIIGLALGVIVGHQFDLDFGKNHVVRGRARFRSEKLQRFFLESTFSLIGHVAKADGHISEGDIRAARRIMHGMALSPEQIQQAIEHFTMGKSLGFSRSECLHRLHDRLRGRRDLITAFMEIQMQAALSVGPISKVKRRVLWQTAQSLGIGRIEFARVEALIRAQLFRTSATRDEKAALNDAYRILGLEPNANNQEIKTAYRRLMNQHHPDKLVARGLPQSMVYAAQEKTAKIRAAYERVKTTRGFN